MLIEKILNQINIKFQNDQKRLNHILNVRRTAINLARYYKVNIFQTQVAALFHDYTKNDSLEFHISNLKPSIVEKYKKTPFVYHAFSAAVILKKEFKCNDIKILNAIKRHVWGHKNMNKLDKIILLSDKIEPQRNYPQVEYFRKLAFINLNQSIYEILQLNYHFYKKKCEIHEEQIKILDSLKKNFLYIGKHNVYY